MFKRIHSFPSVINLIILEVRLIGYFNKNILTALRVLVTIVHIIHLGGEGIVQIDKMSGKPLFEQVILGVKEDILRGILSPGDKILSVREMAAQLMINPNTISKAYKVLEEEDVIVTVRGKGTFVKQLDTETRNDKQINKLKQQFIELVIEASYLNIKEEELIQWIEESSHYFRRS